MSDTKTPTVPKTIQAMLDMSPMDFRAVEERVSPNWRDLYWKKQNEPYYG